jgi:hypothetical protein
MTDATERKPSQPRPGTPLNPITEQMVEDIVAANPKLSRSRCIELLIQPPAARN